MLVRVQERSAAVGISGAADRVWSTKRLKWLCAPRAVAETGERAHQSGFLGTHSQLKRPWGDLPAFKCSVPDYTVPVLGKWMILHSEPPSERTGGGRQAPGGEERVSWRRRRQSGCSALRLSPRGVEVEARRHTG